MNGWMVQWYEYVPAAGARMVVDAPGSTVPESKLWPSSAVTVCAALSSFATLMPAPFWARRLLGENLKLLMVIADDVPDEPPALGAAPALGPLPPPPHPVTSTAATPAAESKVHARNLMGRTVSPLLCAPICAAVPLIASCYRSRGSGGVYGPLVSLARESGSSSTRTGRPGLAAKRVIAGAAGGGVAAAIALAFGASWSVAALCASDVAALVFIGWVWLSVGRADAAATARIARAEDESPVAAESVLIGAGAASLVVVAFTLSQAGAATSPDRGLLTVLAVVSVALAWTSVHTVHALRYARLYYSEPEGGIDFGDDAPDYSDFAYLALTIGMTFQVSDTSLTARRVRRVALHHALLSFVFGAVILAITVNSVAGLLGQ